MRNAKQLLPYLWTALLWGAVGIVALLIVSELVTQARTPLTGDAAIFIAVGRGILNGLHLYTDIFETKPPGIFLVSFLSLKLTASLVLCYVAFLGALSIFWVSIVVRTWTGIPRNHPWPYARACGVLLVSLLALYTTIRAGNFTTTACFSILFTTLYAIVILRERWSRPSLWIAAICIALTMYFREAFALTTLAIALLVLANKHELWKRFVLPSLLALGLFVILVELFGGLQTYITFYLPILFFGRKESLSLLITAYFFVQGLIAFMNFSPFFLGSFLALALGVLCASGKLKWSVLLAMVIAGFGMTFGGGTYEVNAIPFLVVLVWKGIDEIPRMQKYAYAFLPVIMFGALVATIDIGTRALTTHMYEPEVAQQWEKENMFAHALDTVLDDCHIDRYAYLGQNQVSFYATTTHSPLGPIFFMDKTLLSDSLQKSYLANIQSAKIIVVRDQTHMTPLEQTFYDKALLLLKGTTAKQPFSCTKTTAQLEGFTVYERR